jgi:hypothetical protein
MRGETLSLWDSAINDLSDENPDIEDEVLKIDA